MKNLYKLFATVLMIAGLTANAAQATAVLSGNFSTDNYGFAYISTSASTLGTLIGSAVGWNPATPITAANLAPGTTYYLNIEVINGDTGAYSSGGFLADFTLSGGATFSTGATELLTGSTGWLGSYNDANNADTAQPWVAPSGGVLVEGLNGIGPWGTIAAISNAADWIWASNASDGSAVGDQCAACTVDYQAVIQTAAVPEPASLGLMLIGLAGLAAAARAYRRRRL